MARVHRSRTGPGPDFRSLLKRRRWTSNEARAVLETHSRSGLSLTAFARRHGLQVQRLILWRKRLTTRSLVKVAGSTHFLPVRVVGSGPEPAPIEVQLRGGHRLQIHGAFDAAVLARVIEVLEPPAC